MRRLYIALGVLAALLVGGAGYALFQLTILNPPVVAPNFNERKRAERYVEKVDTPPVTSYPSLQAGEARLYRAAGPGRTVLLLPDSGTGAWLFGNYLGTLGGAHRLYAASLRGMLGAAPASEASLDDYLQDARDALAAARRDSGSQKVVLLGEGMGSLLALRLALERPGEIEGLVLVSPYLPRERSAQQDWLVRMVGDVVYRGVYTDRAAARRFWEAGFPAGLAQQDLAARYLSQYALKKEPFEYKGVIQEVVLGSLPWLGPAYARLETVAFPVLHLAGRYDVVNPEASQFRLRGELARSLGTRYAFSVLNSGRLVSIDWKWTQGASVLADFLLDLKLDAPLLETEEPLDPAQERPDPTLEPTRSR